jgi:hypothetical protein
VDALDALDALDAPEGLADAGTPSPAEEAHEETRRT